jgi:phosphatidylinositol alpha-1,6-mannosyltransferase
LSRNREKQGESVTSIDQNRPNILLGSESFALDRGGVSRVGRLVSHVLTDARKDYSLLSLNESKIESELGKSLLACAGSRLRFAAALWQPNDRYTHFMYTHLGIARAHCNLARLRRPYAVWVHGIEVWDNVRSDYLRAANYADTIFTQTYFTRSRAALTNKVFDRAEVCRLGTTEDDAPEPVKFDGEPMVLVVGRLEVGRCKGHDQLIACWAKVASAVKGARLVIAGAGPDASRLRKLAAESPAKESIEFLGFAPEEDMAALWRRAHVFAMPSRGEGFGLVYIEAMRYGVPVIASIHDAGQEVNVDGQTGYNVSLDRPGELGDRLVELLSSPSLVRQMGAAGRARWHEHFRFSAFKRRFLPIVDAFLERGQWNRAASAEPAPASSGWEARPRTRLPTSSAARIDSLRPKANNY